jgi:hypothetical protein
MHDFIRSCYLLAKESKHSCYTMSLTNIITALDYDFGLASNAADSFSFVTLSAEQLSQFSSSPGLDVIALLGGADSVADNDEGRTYFGNVGEDSLYGNGGGDILLGGQDEDFVLGGLGNDVVSGNLGRDRVGGGEGNDTVLGGQGSDILIGGSGNDQVSGDKGDDILFGGEGADTILGGDGNDLMVVDSDDVVIDGGAGINSIFTTPEDFLKIMEQETELKNFNSLTIIGPIKNLSSFTNDARNQKFFQKYPGIVSTITSGTASQPEFDEGLVQLGVTYYSEVVGISDGTFNQQSIDSKYFGFSLVELRDILTSPTRSFFDIDFLSDPSQRFEPRIIATRGEANFSGTEKDDVLVGSIAGFSSEEPFTRSGLTFSLNGLGGNDSMGMGATFFLGGSGNDFINTPGVSLLVGGSGSDTLITDVPFRAAVFVFDADDLIVRGSESAYDIGITDVSNFNEFFLSGKQAESIDHVQILSQGERADSRAISAAESQGIFVTYTNLGSDLIQSVSNAVDNTINGENRSVLPLSYSSYGFSNQDILTYLTASSISLNSITTR